jgi:hypothetical protein
VSPEQTEQAYSAAEALGGANTDDSDGQVLEDDALFEDRDTITAEDAEAPSEENEEEPANAPEGDGEGSIAPSLADEDGDSTGLRVAQIVAGAVAIAAAGSLGFIWWRRRTAVS